MSAPTLDQFADDGTTGSVTLTGVAANALVVLCVHAKSFVSPPAPAFTVSGVTDTTSLTWTQRASAGIDSADGYNYLLGSTWWAVTGGSTSTLTITPTFSNGLTPGTDAGFCAVAFSVTGADNSAPWGSSTSAATAAVVSGTSLTSATVSYRPSYTDTFVFGMVSGHGAASSGQWNVSGKQLPLPYMTFLDGPLVSGGGPDGNLGVVYSTLPWDGGHRDVGFAGAGYNMDFYVAIADAIVSTSSVLSAPPELDKHASSGTNSVTIAGVAASALLVVCVGSQEFAGGAPPYTVTGVTSDTGLTFTERASAGVQNLDALNYQLGSTWWAVTGGSVSDHTITVTFSTSVMESSLVAFSVVGANNSAPWDTTSAVTSATYTSGGPSLYNATEIYAPVHTDAFIFDMISKDGAGTWATSGFQIPASMTFLDGIADHLGVAYTNSSWLGGGQAVGFSGQGYNMDFRVIVTDAIVSPTSQVRPPPAVPGFVSASNAAVDGTVTEPVDMTGANLLVIVGAIASGATVSDSESNTWIQAVVSAAGPGFAGIYYAKNAVVSASQTFTVTDSDNPAWFAYGFSGADSDPLDQTNSSGGGSSSGGTAGAPIQPGSITPSSDGCIIVTGTTNDSGLADPTVDSGFVQPLLAWTHSTNHWGTSAGFLIQDTAAAINPTWSQFSGSIFDAAVIASFKTTLPMVLVGSTSPVSKVYSTATPFSFDAFTVSPGSVLVVAANTGGTTIASISDDASPPYTWSRINDLVNPSPNVNLDYWQGIGGGSGSVTVSVSLDSSTTNTAAMLWELTGCDQTTPVQSAPTPDYSGPGGGDPSPTTPTATPTSSGCLALAMTATVSSTTAEPSSPWVNTNGGNGGYFNVAYQEGLTPGTGYSTSWTESPDPWTAGIVIFQPPVPPAPPPTISGSGTIIWGAAPPQLPSVGQAWPPPFSSYPN